MRATWAMTGDSWAAWGLAASRFRLVLVAGLVLLGSSVPALAGLRPSLALPLGIGLGLGLAALAAFSLRRRLDALRWRSGWAQGEWTLEAGPGGLHLSGPSHVSHLGWRVARIRRHGSWLTLLARGRPPLPIPASVLSEEDLRRLMAWQRAPGEPDPIPDAAPEGHDTYRFAYTIDRKALRDAHGALTATRRPLRLVGAGVALVCWGITALLAATSDQQGVGLGLVTAATWTGITVLAPLRAAWALYRHEDLDLDVSLGPAGMYSRSDGAATSSPWQAFSGLSVSGSWVLLHARSGVTVPLPTHALPVDVPQLERWIRPRPDDDRPGRLDLDNPFASG
jgi:hypothetical protein